LKTCQEECNINKKIFSFSVILLLAAAAFVTIGLGNTIESQKLVFTPQIVCSTFTGNGTLFAGDNNYTLYRSDDNGTSFRLICQFPNQTSNTDGFTGYTMMLFIDSKNDVFVSIPGTSRLYKSDNFGANFTESLKANATDNDGFYVAMTEDKVGNLYTTTYCNSEAIYPQTYMSSDNGKTWVAIAVCSVAHMHNVKVNPSNGYLYIVCGEYVVGGNSHGNVDAERIYRSTDEGKTWVLMIERNMTNPKIYATMVFNGSWVYLGSDMANATNFIDRFYDDGIVGKYVNDTGSPVNVERVFTTSVSDGALPFVSACWFNNSIVFSSSVEFSSGTSRILSSNDGLNWSTIKTVSYVTSQHHCNMLTSNPTNVIIGSDGSNANFELVLKPDPTPTPSPSPVTSPSTTASTTTTTTSLSVTSTPKPTVQPTQEPTSTPIVTSTPTETPTSPTSTIPHFTFDGITIAILAFAVLGIISALTLTIREKRSNKSKLDKV
jgi:hypothetical protein